MWICGACQSRRLLAGAKRSQETYSTAFSLSGRTLAVGYLLGVDLWNVTVRQHPVLESAGPPTLAEGGDGSDSVAFSPDGTILAAGDYDGGLGLWMLPAAAASPRWTKAAP